MNAITCTSFGSDYDCVMEGWEPKENDGAIYFSNSHHRSTSWTHPYIDKIFEEFSEFNDIRYAAYRTALKMRCLQNKSGLGWLTIKGVKKILNSRGEPKDSYRESIVSHKEAFNAIISMFEASDSLCMHRLHFVKAASIIVSLLVELYDTNYEGKFPLSSLKFFLTALCSAQLSEKYRFLYSEIYDYRGQILQRERLLYFFYDLMQITDMLKESTAFGTNVSIAVDSCLNYYTTSTKTGKSSEDAFYSWLLLEPQILVWLPTLHRVAATENVCHAVQCSSCGINPFKGFRYRCLQCFKYDLCQKCFFLGNISLTHKLKHPVQEYCLPATKKDSTKAVFKILRNKLSKKHRSQSKITYLPLDDDSITGSVFQWQPHHHLPNSRDVYCGSSDSGLACSSENDALAAVDVEETEMVINRAKHKDAETKCQGNDQISKKDMVDQQSCMEKRIEELQEENRHLHERLTMLTTQKTSDIVSSDSSNAYTEVYTVTTHETKHSPTLEKNPQAETAQDCRALSPIILNKMDCELHTERQAPDDVRVGSKIGSDDNGDKDSLPNVLEIVGYYTPVRTSSCESEQVLDEQRLDSVKRVPEEVSQIAVSVVEPFDELPASETESDVVGVSVTGNINRKTKIEIATTANSDRDDITSESTVYEGLEYGYSDMSLHSESLSQKVSLKEKETPLPSDEEALECSVKLIVSETPLGNQRNSKEENSIKSMEKENRVKDNATMKQDYNNCEHAHDKDTSKTKIMLKEPQQSGQTISSFQPSEMNTNEIFFDISDIFPDRSAIPALSILSDKPFTPGNDQVPERRMTIEPVFMSTPMAGQPQSSETTDNHGKENKVPGRVKEGSLQLIAFYKCKGQSGVTPKSAVMSRQNKRLLSSRENLSTNSRSDTIDLSNREVGITTMFDKVERLGALEGTSVEDSLAHADKEEMDKLVQKLNMANGSTPEYYKMKHDNDSGSSSMLNAVLNVGDAMADLVQATAEMQEN